MRIVISCIAFGVGVLVCLGEVHAAELSPEAIVEKSYDHNVLDYDSATADMKMELIDKKEISETRKVRVKALRLKKGNEKLQRVLMTFTEPADIAGTSFLSIEKSGDDDDQFLYLPALKRALRKGGKTGKSESFLGTQFSYGDMESKDVKKAAHKRLPDEKAAGIDCYVIESIPKDPDKENYSKYINWINKKTFVPIRIKFFDLKGNFQKVMMTEKVEKIDGKDAITRMTMLNVKNNKATRIYISNIDTKAKLGKADFTKERMTKL